MRIIYEDENIKVLDKPAGINSDEIPNRAHRLDKDTSGVLITAKNKEVLDFLQKQFKEGRAEKKYLALVAGTIKESKGLTRGFLARSPKDKRRQKVWLKGDPAIKEKKLREAVTEYKVLQRFKKYTLIEASPKTGRKHQIRAQFEAMGHPLAGDKLYGFKNQPRPKNLKRQFLHASSLKINLPGGKEKEFHSELPQDLKETLSQLI